MVTMMQRVHALEKSSCCKSRQPVPNSFAPRGFARREENNELIEVQYIPQGRNFAEIPLFPPVQPKLAASRGGMEQEVDAASSEWFDEDVGAAESVQAKPEPNRTGMPDRLKAGIEALSGIDMSDVRVHANSPKPARLNALAYTQGNQIYMGPGQERHLPHEAWHAVQQKQGRVKATRLMKGVWLNDEAGLEGEADGMDTGAMRLESVSTSRLTLFSNWDSFSLIQRVNKLSDKSLIKRIDNNGIVQRVIKRVEGEENKFKDEVTQEIYYKFQEEEMDTVTISPIKVVDLKNQVLWLVWNEREKGFDTANERPTEPIQNDNMQVDDLIKNWRFVEKDFSPFCNYAYVTYTGDPLPKLARSERNGDHSEEKLLKNEPMKSNIKYIYSERDFCQQRCRKLVDKCILAEKRYSFKLWDNDTEAILTQNFFRWVFDKDLDLDSAKKLVSHYQEDLNNVIRSLHKKPDSKKDFDDQMNNINVSFRFRARTPPVVSEPKQEHERKRTQEQISDADMLKISEEYESEPPKKT